MALIVTSSTHKSGPEISGDIIAIVIVRTNPGYAPNPGHRATGTVVGVICGNVPAASGNPPKPARPLPHGVAKAPAGESTLPTATVCDKPTHGNGRKRGCKPGAI
jgi:hypothetical protein